MSLFTGGVALASALGAGGLSLWGSKKAADAYEHGGDVQAEAALRAQKFLEGQKAKQEAAAAPYLSLGGMAAQRLPGFASQGPVQGPPTAYSTQPGATMPARPLGQMGAPMGAQGPQMGGMVMVQAPTGETRQLTQAQAQQAVARGAKIIG